MHTSHGFKISCPLCPNCGQEMRLSRMLVGEQQYYDIYCPSNEAGCPDPRQLSVEEWEAFFRGAEPDYASPCWRGYPEATTIVKERHER